jgi:MFS family permease
VKILRHRNYVLAVLFVVTVFSSIDGFALGLVLQDIKRDLSLTDTQLGLLTGIAFGLFYSVAGIAIARWADRGDRVAIVSIAAATWSVLVAACGMARSFVQLFLIRVGIGIGEAGCLPASQSLIADYFSRAERPRAIGSYLLGAGLNAVVGYGLAGWLNQRYGWRVMFMVLGLPGLAVAFVAWFTLREPRFEGVHEGVRPGRFRLPRRSLLGIAAGSSVAVRLSDAAATLWCNSTLRHLVFFWAVWAFVGASSWQWLPTFFVRSHRLNIEELGTSLAVVFGLSTPIGIYLGGVFASRYVANNETLLFRIAALVSCGVAALEAATYLVHSSYLAFGLLGLSAAVGGMLIAPFWATIQTLVAENIRAAVTAILLLIGNLIGSGLGSLATGALSDALRARFGEDSLRYVLLALSLCLLWAAWYLWQASRSIARDLAAAQQERDMCSRNAYAVGTLPTGGH